LFLELIRQQCQGDTEGLARALAGLRAYQEAPRDPPPEPMPAIGEILGAKLRDYGGTGPAALFVPSLINPPNVLDLSSETSLLRWLAGRGRRVLLLDWGWDIEARRNLSVAGHVEQILLPFVQQLEEPPALVGYCLGGTMALAAAALAKVKGVALIATPWRFAGFGDAAREMLDMLWTGAQPTVESLGLLPMEVLQSAFWSLDPERTVRKFEAFADIDAASAEGRAFVTLEDWANDGPPITGVAAREMFEGFFRQDLPGNGKWIVGGSAIGPERLPCPIFNIASTADRIVPHATATTAGERLDLDHGHVGMIIGGRAKETLWEPLEAWLSRVGTS
jgi:polyhydroxyalkanoate synthase